MSKHHLPRLILISAALAVILIVLAIAMINIVQVDYTVGDAVVRSQRGTTYPLSAALVPSSDPPAECFAPDPVPEIRNVILMIGDGMGLGHISAASGLIYGPGGGLAMEEAEVIGLARTWATNNFAPDSAASGTSLATGYHTDRRAVATLPDGRQVKTLFEAARFQGKATVLVTTSNLVDATPACFVAHTSSRNHYAEIFRQMLDSGTDIMIGGEWKIFAEPAPDGEIADLAERARTIGDKGYTLVRTESELLATQGRILGLFPTRNGSSSANGPQLEVTTRHILGLLAEHENGFVAMIESEVLDQAGHDNDIAALVEGMREFDDAVRVAVDFVNGRDDTLLIVTADHDTGGVGIVEGPFDEGLAEIRWVTDYHTSNWLPVLAFGAGAERFAGVGDTSHLPCRMAQLLGLRDFPSPTLPGS